MFRITLPNNYSVECFFEETVKNNFNIELLQFFVRDTKKNILIQFQYEDFIKVIDPNELYEIKAMIPLHGNLFAVVTTRKTVYDRYSEELRQNNLLIFNAEEGVLVSNTEIPTEGMYATDIVYANGLIYVGIRNNIHIYNVKANPPVHLSVNTIEEKSNIIAMRRCENNGFNRLVVATRINVRSYHLSSDLTDLKNKETECKELESDDYMYSSETTLLPKGTLIAIDRRDPIELVKIKHYKRVGPAILQIPKNLSPTHALESTVLPTGNLAILYQGMPETHPYIVIYSSRYHIAEHIPNVTLGLNYRDTTLAYYIEYWELIKARMQLIREIPYLILGVSNAPKALINLICSYICDFSSVSISNLQMRDWCTVGALFHWNTERSCITYENDKKRDWFIFTNRQDREGKWAKSGVEDTKLLPLENRKIEADEIDINLGRILYAFKKIYPALYDGRSTIWKGKNFLAGKEQCTDTELKTAIDDANDETVNKAFELACKHYKNIKENERLFTEIYKYCFSNSGWLKRSCITGHTFFKTQTFDRHVKLITQDKIDPHKEDNTRGGKIYRALTR